VTASVSDELKQYGGLATSREEEQKQHFAQSRLYALQIESTDACHQGCIYCYAGPTSEEGYGLSSAEIRGLLEDAAALDIRAIDWLGGDPFLRRDWAELMAHARSLGLVNNVWTSGLPLAEEEVARRVYELTEDGFVSVHLDSVTPETYVKLHRGGQTENVATIVSGVDNLLALGKSPDEMINCITYRRSSPPPGSQLRLPRDRCRRHAPYAPRGRPPHEEGRSIGSGLLPPSQCPRSDLQCRQIRYRLGPGYLVLRYRQGAVN
jgi:hypothetical protein